MLNQFYNNNKHLINFTSFMVAICGLFLNIATPSSEQAKSSLDNLQTMMLLIFIVSIFLLFVKLTRFLWSAEKELGKKYDVPTKGLITFVAVYTMVTILLNLVGYFLAAHPQASAPFSIGMMFIVILLIAISPILLMDKYQSKFSAFSRVLSFSFSGSVLVTLLFATIQLTLFKWFSFFWGYLVLPILFVLIAILGFFVKNQDRK
jgi:uncharacterized membrane protein